ncbi:SpaA isopeptide-forming pilin-related protein [Cellulosimicrobium cellulans]|uniref:DUF7933 domain-containing protein n=1 Tax=Cellulosimicrobium cellulans TaxID=1710 RepID=UPI0036E92028
MGLSLSERTHHEAGRHKKAVWWWVIAVVATVWAVEPALAAPSRSAPVAGLVPAAAANVGPIPSALVAAPGNPGVPHVPEEVFLETFENGTAGAAEGLEEYPGTDGVTYTAEYPWLEQTDCNGTILSYSVSVSPCPNGSNQAYPRDNTRRLADVLGQVAAGVPGGTDANPANGSNPTTQANRALTAFTNTINPAANTIALRTVSAGGIGGLTSDRFLTFSVDVAELSCTFLGGVNVSRLNFFLVYDGVEHPTQDAPITACTDPSAASYTSPTLPSSGGWGTGGTFVRAGTYIANSSLLVPGGSDLGIVMRNATGTGVGNDFAFDNIRLLDVSPQLDKSFSPTSVPVGGTSTLTFTVTNTSELGAKSGWSFTDNMPDGLVVADVPNTGGTCVPPATVDATAGASSIAVTGGNLSEGQVSCTISVDVTSDAPQGADSSPKRYSNCPATNVVDLVGLQPPACADVEFFSEPALALTKTSDATEETRVGDIVTYVVTATNTGDGDYTAEAPAIVMDDLSGVLDDATYNGDAVADPAAGDVGYAEPLLSWTGPIAVGETVTLRYSVTLNAAGDHHVRNVAWQPADPGTPVTPACDPPTGEGTDSATGEPCAPEEFSLPDLAVLVEKLGESIDGSWVRMQGSTWALLADSSGVPGEVLHGSTVDPVDGQTGLFRAADLRAGTYWLTETKAPEGFALLAEHVQFRLDADGTITLLAGDGDGVVSAAAAEGGIFQITVRDVPALELPETGGTGSGTYALIGVLFLAAAGLLVLVRRRHGTA